MPGGNGRRVVVAGATGLIGSELVRRLAARGDRVTVLARGVARARTELPEAAEHLRWDSSMSDGPWVAAIDGADAVVNLAGAPVASRWTPERKKILRASRIDGTHHIVEAIARAERRPSVLVNASAVGYYGSCPPGQLDESSPAGIDFLGTLCWDWEAEAQRAAALGTRVVLMRTGLVLDPRDGALASILLPFRLFVGGPIGSGQQPFPWIHIEDELELLLWAIDNPEASGPINAVAPGIVTNREFSRALGRRLGRPSLIPVPPLALRLLFGQGAEAVVGGQWAHPRRALKLGYRFRHPLLEEALASLPL